MERILTVAIPTYNRAALLDRQLLWFAEAVKGREQDCALVVSDNCSTDDTPEVVAKWGAVFAESGIEFRANRNRENLGPIRNIARCIRKSNTKYIWTVSDDDTVAPHALRFVLERIEEHPDLGSLILNFSHRNSESGVLKFARCFEVDQDQVGKSGKEIFERALRHPEPGRWGGLVLTTAQVYRTAAAQAALRQWPEGLDNLYMQFFVTAYCARQKTILTREPFLEMAGGRHFFSGQRRMQFHFKLGEMPESLVKVAELGYSRDLCLEKVAIQRKKIRNKLILRYLLDEPFATLHLLRRHRNAIRRIRGCSSKMENFQEKDRGLSCS